MDVKLVMFTKDGQQKSFPIGDGATVIGRAEDCGLRVPIGNVSRRHCELTVSGEELSVKDLGSANGTFVNNKRITEADLEAGDRLVLGPIVFTVQIDGVPTDVKPVRIGKAMVEADEPGAEEIVDLEADIFADVGTSAEEAMAAMVPEDESTKDIDPISALEALADEAEDAEEADEAVELELRDEDEEEKDEK